MNNLIKNHAPEKPASRYAWRSVPPLRAKYVRLHGQPHHPRCDLLTRHVPKFHLPILRLSPVVAFSKERQVNKLHKGLLRWRTHNLLRMRAPRRIFSADGLSGDICAERTIRPGGANVPVRHLVVYLLHVPAPVRQNLEKLRYKLTSSPGSTATMATPHRGVVWPRPRYFQDVKPSHPARKRLSALQPQPAAASLVSNSPASKSAATLRHCFRVRATRATRRVATSFSNSEPPQKPDIEFWGRRTSAPLH